MGCGEGVRSGTQRAAQGLAHGARSRALSPRLSLMSLSGCFLLPPGLKGSQTRALTLARHGPPGRGHQSPRWSPTRGLACGREDGRPSARNAPLSPHFLLKPSSRSSNTASPRSRP